MTECFFLALQSEAFLGFALHFVGFVSSWLHFNSFSAHTETALDTSIGKLRARFLPLMVIVSLTKTVAYGHRCDGRSSSDDVRG